MKTTKPLLLLDVDGVVSAFHPIRSTVSHDVAGHRLRVDPDLRRMLDTLQKFFEIHFCTMWNDSANRYLPAIGVGPYPTMECDPDMGEKAALGRGVPEDMIPLLWYAKTPLVPSYVKGRPFAWIDDYLTKWDEHFLSEQEDVTYFLLVPTDGDIGITWDHVETLVDWSIGIMLDDVMNMVYDATDGRDEGE